MKQRSQRLPPRAQVLHRRANMERPRRVLRLRGERLEGQPPGYFALRLRTKAGTYVKEFVHGAPASPRSCLALLPPPYAGCPAPCLHACRLAGPLLPLQHHCCLNLAASGRSQGALHGRHGDTLSARRHLEFLASPITHPLLQATWVDRGQAWETFWAGCGCSACGWMCWTCTWASAPTDAPLHQHAAAGTRRRRPQQLVG